MATDIGADQSNIHHRPELSLPPLSQVIDGNERGDNLEAPTRHNSPRRGYVGHCRLFVDFAAVHRNQGEVTGPTSRARDSTRGRHLEIMQISVNFGAPARRDSPRPGSTPTRDVWRAVPNTSIIAFEADEVMRKVMETMNEQTRANGYDPNNLPNRNTYTTTNGNNQVGAGTTLHLGNSVDPVSNHDTFARSLA